MIVLCSLGWLLAASQAQSGAQVTVYNQGFALVKENRQFTLRSGRQEVLVEDVAEQIEPSSVAIVSTSKPGSFEVIEQNYQYDLISPQAILAKAVGKTVAFLRVLPNGTKERVEGVLLSSPYAVAPQPGGGGARTYQGMVLRTNDNRILLDPSGEIEVQSIPEGLISKPTLVWDLLCHDPGPNTVELSYLTRGMSWDADYVLSLDEAGASAVLKGWVTLNNQSGATYRNATLKLLAGEVQRAQRGPMDAAVGRGGAEFAKAAPQFQEEQFAEYHLYTLQRPTTLKNREMKQVSLLESDQVPVQKKLVVDAMRNFRGYRASEGEVGTGPIKPQFRVEFTNNEASHLGMPLPKGTIKVFQRDKGGSVQMLGEDTIDHTPKNEKVSLVVGRSFDIIAERKRTAFEYVRDPADRNRVRGAKETFEIELRNRKETPETVTVIERFWGEYKIMDNNMPFEKLDSETIQFLVPLKPNEVKKVSYTVEWRW